MKSNFQRLPPKAGFRIGKIWVRNVLTVTVDLVCALLTAIVAPALKYIARARSRAPITRGLLDGFDISIVQHHYYEPVIFPKDLLKPLTAVRELPGVDLNESGQMKLIDQFHFRDELLQLPLTKDRMDKFGYNNGAYESGDAELLYDVIRHFKPKRIVEIGSGQSTLMAKIATGVNLEEDASQSCTHICIEPYEQPWLESTGVRVIRQRVECCDKSLFQSLEENDILFIDSSHVIRPQGDVLFEFQEVIPTLKKGVLVHVHDIFTPRDYPAEWIVKERRTWNEQYLLETFLAFNPEFHVLLAANWLKHEHLSDLADACPVLLQQPDREPGAFWFSRNS